MTKKHMTDLGLDFIELPAATFLPMFDHLGADREAPLVLVLDGNGDVFDHWTGLRPDRISALAIN